MMSFKEAIKVCFKKYFKISGRATRAEYWWFQLFFCLVVLLPSVIGFSLQGTNNEILSGILVAFETIVFFVVIIPAFCVKVRRYHDTGNSGFLLISINAPLLFVSYFENLALTSSVFLSVFQLLGILIDFIFMLLKSAPDNEWGPNPFNEQKETTIESEVVAKQEENKNVIDVEL